MRKKILFLCTGNACRSQMAEGWLKHLAAKSYDVYSAGIVAHGKNPRAITAMHDAGVDISSQQSEQLDPSLFNSIDLLITVCANADESCPTIPVTCEKQHWPFDDPAKAEGTELEIMAEFCRVRDQIRQRIELFIHSGTQPTL